MTERLDRELSWINFNSRVLEEGLRRDLPPLERFRFLSIVSSNFDEFFMVRIAGLKQALAENGDGNPAQVLQEAAQMIRTCYAKLYQCLDEEVFPALAAGGLELRRPPFTPDEIGYLKPLFMQEILPVLTPLRLGPANTQDAPEPEHPAPPSIAGGILYGAFLLDGAASENSKTSKGEQISIAGIPHILERIIRIDPDGGSKQRWALLDDLLMLWGDAFFPGYEVKDRLLFRIHRDAYFSVDEKRDDDFLEAMEEMLFNRGRSQAVRMVYTSWDQDPNKKNNAGSKIVTTIARYMELSSEDLFSISGPLNLGSLGSLATIQGFEKLKRKPPKPCSHPAFPPDLPVWNTIRAGDVLLSLPYQSFDPVIRFFEEAASDPDVISIKTTLYRTSGNSPIIHALEQAALNGKHVTAVLELKARFDEGRNISWANQLEQAGVIVIYGIAGLKVHAKICQVIRREASALVQYLHFSTGNYNDKTARLYSDLCLFTCREDFGNDTAMFFNMLSGYSIPLSMQNLVMAPRQLKQKLVSLIDREAKRSSQGSPGRIMAKMNSLVDGDVADALYRASRAGVTINLNIRGICTLAPGRTELSENIRVVSIIDNFLEHSRIFYFSNGGAEEFFISSADWMPRNLERRVELLIPVLDEKVREELRNILEAYFKDNTQAWVLDGNGNWKRRSPSPGEAPFRSQGYLQGLAEKAAEHWKTPQDFIVRRSAPGNMR
ncbi:MAG: polyphosphate kinase 1 [Treponema sp.]|nr:polyphosphate kinase 1 [Treponema sp.]